MEKYADFESMQAALEAQMKAQGQSAGLRQLRQIMIRMVKGEAGLAIEVWRTAMKDESRLAELDALRADLEEHSCTHSHTHTCRSQSASCVISCCGIDCCLLLTANLI